jgi:hypothetical protein
MSGTPRALAALVVFAMCSLLFAACGSNAPSKTGGASGPATNVAKAVKFSECMRNNGVSAFPDPNASGQLTIDGVVNGSSLDPNSASFVSALRACKGLEPSGFMGQTRSISEQQGALKFAQCMRSNGVPSFPDPSLNGPIISVHGAHSIPGFQAGVQKCRSFLVSALGNQ